VAPRAVAVGGNTVFVADPGAWAVWTLPASGGAPKQLLHDERLRTASGGVFHDHTPYVLGWDGPGYKNHLTRAGFGPRPAPPPLHTPARLSRIREKTFRSDLTDSEKTLR